MLLALDTATDTASLALYEPTTETLLVEYTWQARRRHTQDLLRTAQLLLPQAGIAPDQITALAVTTGPGSFTGVRIAISAAKGIALGLPTPPQVIGLPTLAVTAAPWLALAAHCQPQPLVCAYLQAGRGRYNWVYFQPDHPEWRPDAADHVAGTAAEFIADLTQRAAQPVWLVGELDPALKPAATLPHVQLLDAVASTRRAGNLAALAAAYFARGQCDDLHAVQPLYLRNP